MSNDGDGPHPDPEKQLEARLSELQERAQQSYDEDPVRSLIMSLQDTVSNLDEGQFRDGYYFALYHATVYYIQYSGLFPCRCSNSIPFPEQLRGGEFVCADCDATLADDICDAIGRDRTEVTTDES